MAIRIVRLGTARRHQEGLRIGTVRRPSRGVRKEDYARLDYFDVWLPELAPSAALVLGSFRAVHAAAVAHFERRYQREMGQPAALRVIALLAAISSQMDFSVGRYL